MGHFNLKFEKNTGSFSFLNAFLICIITLLSQASLAQTVTITTTGAGTFTVPCDVTSITVEAWGGGGAGGGSTANNDSGDGGGGGGYTTNTLTVSTGQTINYTIGNGGNGSTGDGGNGGNTSFLSLIANGGSGGNRNGGSVTGIGGTASGGTNTTGANGTAGGTGTGGNGGNGANGGAGGNGRSGNNGYPGIAPGGGGGGGEQGGGNRSGGNGGNGQIRITYTSSLLTYCSPTFDDGVRPITNVTFAGINNTTSATINGTNELESFCDIATVVQGSATNAISVKGNTNGNNTYYFRVYIDWDQNGTFGNNPNEIYNLGTINNSTGLDAKILISNISVPAGATLGATRMRVMTRYNVYSNGPCQNDSNNAYGQAEDYTVIVTGPPVITTFPASACAGSSIVINGTNLDGATAVTIGGIAVTSIDSNTNTAITVTIANGSTGPISVTTPGGTDTTATNLTVYALPATPANPTSDSPICSPSGVTITANGTAPVGETWYWQTAADGISTTNNAATALVVTTVGSSTRYIRSYNGTCWSDAASIDVTVNQTPTINTQPSTPAAICAGQGTVTISVVAAGVTTFQWQFNGSNITNGGVFGGTDTATLILTNPIVANAGSYTVVLNGATCPVTSDPVTVTINDAPATPANPTNNSPQCTDTGVIITAAGTIPGGETWYWQTTAGGTSMTNDASIPLLITALGATTRYIRAYNGTCWSVSSGSTTVTVNQSASIITQPVATAAVCSGQGNITVSVVANNVTSAQWQLNGTNISNNAIYSGVTTQTLLLTNPTSANAGTYTVILNGPNCPVTSDPVTVTINDAPATPGITSNSPQCTDSGVTITASGIIPGGETWYWQTSAGGTSMTDDASIPLVITALGTTTRYIRAYNGTCWSVGSASTTVVVNQSANIQTQPVAPATICAGQGTLTLSVIGTGFDTYQWKRNGTNVPNNAIVSGGTSATLTLLNPGTGNAGNYTVVINEGTCPLISDIAVVTIDNAPLTPGNPTASSPTACTPSGITMSANGTIPAGETWYWQTTAGGTSMTDDASTPLMVTALGTTTVFIRAYNGACWSAGSGSRTVTINQTPTITTQPIAPAQICTGQGTIILSVSGMDITTYQWQRDGVNVPNNGIVSGGTTQTLTFNNPTFPNYAGSYTVVVNGGTCPVVSDAVAVVINALPANPGNPSSNSPQCTATGATITAVGSAPLGETWYWQTTAGGTSMADDASTPLVITALGSTTRYIRAFNGSCWSLGAGSRTVIVNQTPTIITQPVAPAQICTGQGTIVLSVTAVGFTTFQWKRDGTTVTNGGGVSGATTATLTLVNPGVGSSGNYTVVLNNATCPIISDAVAVVINALPVNPGTPTSNTPQCNPAGVTLTRSGTPPTDVDWYWQTAANGTDMSSNGATYTANTTGTYYSRAYNTVTGCWSSGAGARAVVVNNPMTTLATNPIPADNATDLCYKGTGTLTALNWSAAAGALNYDVYFGTTATPTYLITRTQLNAATGALAANTTYYWRVVPKNICGETIGTVITWSFTTNSLPCYCDASVSNGQQDDNYINDVKFIGTLNDINNLGTGYSNSPRGYQDFTGLTNRAIQAQGEGVNVFLESNSTAFIRAWVDWNNDGDFADANEAVYTSNNISAISTTFGFAIPALQIPGLYRIRLRTNEYGGSSTYDTCGNINNGGETEDYLFEVVSSCNALITSITKGESCGLPLGGNVSVPLSVGVSAGTTEVRWYDALTAGNLVNTSSISGTSSSFTPSIATTTTYYATAFNGVCESLVRTGIVAKVKPVANITYTPANPESCGEDSIVTLTAAGDNEVVTLIDEDFEAATPTLGVFSSQPLGNNNNSANWRSRTSTFIPAQQVWFPAISSGFGANKFAMATSDLNLGSFNNALRSPVSPTVDFVNLTLTFRMYYSDYSTAPGKDNVFIEVATNAAGTNWTIFHTYDSIIGVGTQFEFQTFDMSAYVNEPNFRFRIRYASGWADGVAIDDIKLFGDRPLAPSFSWTGVPAVAAFTDAAATIPYVSGNPATTVYIKPTLDQLELGVYNFTATATLSNGCTTSQPITITNKSRVWKGTVDQDWNNPNNWLPYGVPTADNCVVIPATAKIQSTPGYNAYAKNVTIKNTGNLELLSGNNLTVTDFVHNQGANNFDIRNNASLIQINSVANIGSLKMDRTATVKKTDYLYYSSPVDGFSLANLSPLTPNAVKFRWLPTTAAGGGFSYGNWFTPGAETMGLGTGYIVRGPSGWTTPQSLTAVFDGVPRNGDITVPISRGNYVGGTSTYQGRTVTDEDDNYNLIGNPYPSAINADTFLDDSQNDNILGSIYLWPHGGLLSDANPDPFYQDFVYNYDSADYITYSGMGSLPAGVFDGYIAAGQSFFVLMTDAASQSENLYFKNTMRVRNNNSQFLRMEENGNNSTSASEPIERHRIYLDIVLPNGKTSSTLVGYTPNATNGFDRLYDTPRFDADSQSIYSKIGDDALTIQGRPTPIDHTDRIPLGVLVAQQGIYNIAISSLDGDFTNAEQQIYLEDVTTGIIHNLKNAPYMFTANVGRYDNRFFLRYDNDNTLNMPELVTDSEIKIVKLNSIVKVTSKNSPIKSIALYDVLGRLVLDFKNLNTNEYKIPLDNLSEGTFIVKATLHDDKQKTKKIVQ